MTVTLNNKTAMPASRLPVAGMADRNVPSLQSVFCLRATRRLAKGRGFKRIACVSFTLKLIFLVFLLGSTGFSSIVLACDLELARHLLVAGEADRAYSRLAPCEFEQAGDTKFDYLLGLAALNSNQAGVASIILERVLIVDPLYAAARVDLGRAYYMLGDFEHARAEFTRAMTLNPPPAALAVIKAYRLKLDTLNKNAPIRLSGYLELGGGYNDNVNNATSQSQIIVPMLLNTQLALNTANIKTADRYWGLATGAELIYPATRDWSFYAAADIRERSDLKYRTFDFISLDTGTGVIFNKDAELIRAGYLTGRFDLGGALNRKSDGFNAQWSHSFNSTNQSVLFAQSIRYRYPAITLTTNDFDQTIEGFGWIHASVDGHTTVSGSFYGGHETATNLRIDGNKKILGMRLSWQLRAGEKMDLFASGGLQRGQFDKTNSTFLVMREDHQRELSVGLTYRMTPDWILRPQINFVKNKSNIVVNQYDQTNFSLTLRREFK
jgi:tetratricopeptide (TPR) repeat protein